MANGQRNSENSLMVLRCKRYLSRYWRGDASMLSFIFVAAIIAVITFTVLFMSVATVMVFTVLFGPYNPSTKQINEFANRIAPDIFLSNEPQHIVVVGSFEAENLDVSNVAMANVAEDGLGVLTIPRNTLTEIPEGHGSAEIDKAFALGGST
jgi:anionic cell wall polymer biosynthesis LytR-Cps2A-Psr (LCP) family protein